MKEIEFRFIKNGSFNKLQYRIAKSCDEEDGFPFWETWTTVPTYFPSEIQDDTWKL